MEGQIAFTSFNGSQVGPVHLKSLGQRLLRQTKFVSVPLEVSSEDDLEARLVHTGNARRMLLIDLQTDK